MRRANRFLVVVLAGALAAGGASAAWAAPIDAAGKAISRGEHVYVDKAAKVQVDAKALAATIGDKPIFVVVIPQTKSEDANKTASDLARLTRANGTYIVVDGTAIGAGSNSLGSGLAQVRKEAAAAHPKDPSAALTALVTAVATGQAAKIDADLAAANAAKVKSQAPAEKADPLSKLFLLALIPLIGALVFAFGRARRTSRVRHTG